MGFGPSAALPSGQAEAVLYLFLFSLKQKKKPSFHSHGATAAAQVVQGFDPQNSFTRLRIRHAGWGRQT